MTGPKPRARREHRLHSGPGVRRVPLHVERQGSHTSIPAPHINKPPWPQAVHARAHGTSTSGTSSLGLPDSVSSWPYHRSSIQGGAYSSGCLPMQQPQSPRWLGAHPPQRGQERKHNSENGVFLNRHQRAHSQGTCMNRELTLTRSLLDPRRWRPWKPARGGRRGPHAAVTQE